MNSDPLALILYSDLHGIVLAGFALTLGYDKKLPQSRVVQLRPFMFLCKANNIMLHLRHI